MPAKRLGSSLRRHGTIRELLPDPLPRSEAAEKMAAVAVTSGPIALALSALSTNLAAPTTAPVAEAVNFDTDEWDPQRGAFWQHAVAGSAAGLAEHSVMFPVDTVKTHMQVNAATRASLLQMVQAQGVPRMWRGVQTMLAGCIPAHAAYFSIFEALKPRLTHAAMGLYNPASLYSPPGSSGVISGRLDALGGSLAVGPHDAPAEPGPTAGNSEMAAALGAGAAVTLATVAHDLIMTPMDVIKQRLQLGHHENQLASAFRAIMAEQGARAFFVSLPLTLGMNMPYAALMGTSNEFLRQRLTPPGEEPGVVTHMAAGAGAGTAAAALTNPLDVIKTRLQTQHVFLAGTGASSRTVTSARSVALQPRALLYEGVLPACAAVFREGGAAGFFRGAHARMLVHAPSVALCWTTYEAVKRLLERVAS